ncbi:MAG: glycine--tRNA ligase subunit beta, partial [Alphaproteobacteria bacterium]
MPELLLELLSEEIPARMQARAADDLKRLVTEGLTKAGLSFENAQAYATPRRLTLVVDGIPAKQPDIKEERKGPKVGAPDQAIQGFLKSANLTSLDQCEKREVKGNEHWFVVSEKKGGAAAKEISDIIYRAIWSFAWPKSMCWSDLDLRWVRPLENNILGVFDGRALEFSFSGIVLQPGDTKKRSRASEADTQFGFVDKTKGHRFLSPKPFTVKDFADYKAK